MTPEGKVKLAVKKLLKQYPNTYSHWPVQTGYGAPTLDCVGSVNSRLLAGGVSFAVETKYKDDLTPRQRLTKAAMERGGVTVFIIGQYVYSGFDGKGEDYSGLAEFDSWLRRHLSL